MELEKIEKELKRVIEALDRGIRLEAVLEEGDTFQAILAKGNHSDRATLSRELLEDFLERGKREHELKKALGKVISKLNRTAQKRL